MEMGTRKKRNNLWNSWRCDSIYLWYRSNITAANFGRVYAAYGGIFIVCSVLWGIYVDKKKPDRFEIIGSLIAILGAIIIFYSPR